MQKHERSPHPLDDLRDGSKESMNSMWGMILRGLSRYHSPLSAPVKETRLSTVLVTPPLHTLLPFVTLAVRCSKVYILPPCQYLLCMCNLKVFR